MSCDPPAVVVAAKDGRVLAQNAAARRLMGTGTGRPCWELVGTVAPGAGLPCEPGCAGALLSAGGDRSRHTSFQSGGRRHHLTCTPVDQVVVCTLDYAVQPPARARQILSPRECEVLQLLAAGETTQSVAARLELSESTVRTHVENMRLKLGVNTRSALVAQGFRLGYID